MVACGKAGESAIGLTQVLSDDVLSLGTVKASLVLVNVILRFYLIITRTLDQIQGWMTMAIQRAEDNPRITGLWLCTSPAF